VARPTLIEKEGFCRVGRRADQAFVGISCRPLTAELGLKKNFFASFVEVQKRTAEYRITNYERRRKEQKRFNFMIRNSLFDIRHSGFGISIWLRP
jgi:hypothetical protein